MKRVWVHLVVAAASNWVALNYVVASPEPAQEPKPADVVWVTKEGNVVSGTNGQFITLEGEGDGDGQFQWVVSADAEVEGDGSGDSKPKMVTRVITRGPNAEEDKNRGWMGVMLGTVSETLKTQLGDGNEGVIVLEVVEDSPAEAAGLQAHDIILSLNGTSVTGDIGQAVELVKGFKPGDNVSVAYLRGGNRQSANVTLASRADMRADIEEKVRTTGRFIQRGPGGEWKVQELKNLGDLDVLKHLPQNLHMFVPRNESRTTQVTVNNGARTIKTNVERDGSTIIIEQQDGEDIVVTRTDASGNDTTATYEDEDALQAADEEAFELLQQTGNAFVFHLGDGDGDGEDEFDVHVELDGWDESMSKWREELEEHLGEASEAYERAKEEFHKIAEQFHHGAGGLFRAEPMAGMHFAHIGKPKHTFEVRADGTIEVKIRKGDSELVQLYKNADDLARRNPELSAKYQDLMAEDGE